MKNYYHLSTVFFVLMAAFSVIPVSAESGLSVRQYNEHNGLPNRQVYDIRTDSAGYVWLFSNSGIARFDGNEFRSYTLEGLNLSPQYAPYYTKLKTSDAGNICLSVSSGQIFSYDPVQDKFNKNFDFGDYNEDARLNNFYTYGDTTLLSTSSGVMMKDGDSLRCVALKGEMVNDIIDAGNGLWIVSATTGLYCLRSGSAEQWTSLPVAGSQGIHFIGLANCNGKIFAGTRSDGLWVCPLDGREAYRCDISFPAMPFTMLVSEGDSLVLAGVDGAGVYVVDAADESLRNHLLYDPSGNMLSANTISGISRNKSGDGLWVSTSSHGINYIVPGSPAVSLLTYDRSNVNSLRADCVNVVFQDSEGDMWYGTDAGVSLRRKNGEWSHFLGRSKGIDTNILTIAQAPDGKFYAGGYGSGAWMIDKSTGSTTRLPSLANGRGIGTEYVYDILCGEDDVWFGGIQGELTHYVKSTDSYYYYPADCVSAMERSADGTIYFAGCAGVGTYTSDSTLTWRRTIGGLDVFSPRDLAYDSKRNEMWFAAENQGLVRYKIDEDEAELFTEDKIDGLSNIQGVVADNKNRIWFYTERDLYVVTDDANKILRATPFLDIEDVSFLPRAVIIDKDGNIVIGTTQGALTVDSNLKTGFDESPKIVLTSLTVADRLRTGGSEQMPVALDNLDCLTLKNDENTFTIHFSALSFGNNRRLSYRWRLKGYDDGWQNAMPTRDLSFRNIPFGRYTLEIDACNALTGEVMSSRSLSIRILPPLWLSWWAITVYVLVALVLTVVIVRFIRRRRREKNIADKIHSFLNIVHDLRTPVTLIKAPLGEIENQKDLPDDTVRNARLAMSNVDKLLSMIGRLLDLRHESQHSDCLNLCLTDVGDILESKVQEFKVAAINKGLQLTVDVPSDMPAVMMDCNKISHILDNLVSNAIKYTFSGGVRISARYDRKRWYIEISDTGIGIARSDIQRLFSKEFRGANAIRTEEAGTGMGLLIVHRLCKLHEGTVRTFSKENEGTTFVLSFPMSYRRPYRIVSDLSGGDMLQDEETEGAGTDDKETIVIIDDEKEILDYLTDALSNTYAIVRYTDAAEALGHIAEISPDIVISDVRLKGMSGFELCQKIKSSVETSHIPVVLLSGLSERENIILGLESGASDYIVKPFDISVLRLRLRNILKMRQRIQAQLQGADTGGDEEAVPVNSLDREFIEKVRSLIDGHLSDSEYGIAEICRDIGMSRTTLFKKIKALTGEGINEFIRSHRLNKGKALLEGGGYSVSEVAYMVGFADPKYFSSTFKRKFGVSPSKM